MWSPFASELVSDEWVASSVDDWSLWQHYPEANGLTGAKLIPKKHATKLLCMAVAGNDIIQFDTIYRRTRWSEVRLLQGLQAAATFQDKNSGDSEGDDTT